MYPNKYKLLCTTITHGYFPTNPTFESKSIKLHTLIWSIIWHNKDFERSKSNIITCIFHYNFHFFWSLELYHWVTLTIILITSFITELLWLSFWSLELYHWLTLTIILITLALSQSYLDYPLELYHRVTLTIAVHMTLILLLFTTAIVPDILLNTGAYFLVLHSTFSTFTGYSFTETAMVCHCISQYIVHLWAVGTFTLL